MIKEARLIKTFTSIAGIPGLSKQEKLIADELARRLRGLGIQCKFDRALKNDGQVGNLIAYLKGNVLAPPLLLNAHMDTVGPIENHGWIRRGNFLESRGKSILGADDRSGVAVILEVLEHLAETNAPHPPLEVVFTVAEEIGLMGVKQLDCSMLRARHGIVLDSGNPLQPVVAAPQAYKLTFKVQGKAAHAGVSPERGINALQVAAKAISRIKIGRIDFETTANIGIMHSGTATNIVPESAEVFGEARSHNLKKLNAQIKHMRHAFRKAVSEAKKPGTAFAGLPRLTEKIEFDYPRMKLTGKDPMVRLKKNGGKQLGRLVAIWVGGGGSDANILNARKIQCLILGSGMERVHSVEERLNLDHLILSARLLARAIELFPQFANSK